VWLVDLRTGRAIASAGVGQPTDLGASALSFGADGRYLAAAGGFSGTARVYRASGLVELVRLPLPVEASAAVFSRDGRSLITIAGNLSNGGTAQLWRWRAADLVGATCSRVTSNLSAADWRLYAGSEPYHRTCPRLPIGQG
jgi:hypothetical protein